ncbi:MAG: hypothetical protein ACR2FU_11710 [Streptosporangiaceae bacterium]
MEPVRDRSARRGGGGRPAARAGRQLRSDVITGIGGKQVLVEDPSGNLVELFEPIVPEARLDSSS